MSSDDHNDSDRRQGGDDEVTPTRDARGRWLPGFCPNRKGRGKKEPKLPSSQSDIRDFGKAVVDLIVNGQEVPMDRRSALLAKMYETAMKGKVTMQRYLYEAFEKNDERLAALRFRYDQLTMAWIFDKANYYKPDTEIPHEVRLEIRELEALLNHYFPNDYPLDSRVEFDDDEDDK